jgi:hypothetical protein
MALVSAVGKISNIDSSNLLDAPADSLNVKGIENVLKMNKHSVSQMKSLLTLGIRSIQVLDMSFSPKFYETMILFVGTVLMACSKLKSFKSKETVFSKATKIGGSFLDSLKGILTMHQLMKGIVNLATKRKLPLKEISIAGAMIMVKHLANRNSK